MRLTAICSAMYSVAACARKHWVFGLFRSEKGLSTPRQSACGVIGLTFTAACGLAGVGQASAQGVLLAPLAGESAVPAAPWRIAGLPVQGKTAVPVTRFDITPLDGQKVLRVQTDGSYGNLVHALPGISLADTTQLRWRWRLDKPLLNADLRQRRGDDLPLKVCLLFDLPTAKLGLVDRSMLSLARSVSGEKLPTATLCYVWDHLLPAGTMLNNAYTSRVRMLVLGSGDQRLGQWVSHQRDVAADFKRAFGRESDTLPGLDGVLIGADSDNAGGQSLAFVSDVTLGP